MGLKNKDSIVENAEKRSTEGDYMTENENDFDWSVYDYLVYKYGNIQKAWEEIEKEFGGDPHEK